MFKKGLSILVAVLLMTTVFTGCVNQNNVQKGKTGNYSKHYKYTINVLGAEKHGKDAAYKYMADKFNVEFEFIPVSWNDWSEKTRIWMATGDMPDMMWADIQNYNMNEYLSWVSQGLVREMPDLSKFENLKAIKDNLKSDKYFMQNGKSYAWVSPRNNNLTKDIQLTTFLYRADWAKKLGLQKDVYSWDEFLNLAKEFTQKDPGGNGAGKTIGVAGLGGAYPHFSGMMQISPYWEQYFLKDGKYVWGLGEPETLEGIKEAKKMYDQGILWQDQILAKSNDGITKFHAGEAGIAFNGWSPKSIRDARDNLKKVHPEVDTVSAIQPMYVNAPNGKLWGQKSLDYWTISLFNKNLDDDKMNRLLEIFDWIAGPEGKKMAEIGVEGKDYNMVNGKVELIPTTEDNANHFLKTIVRALGDAPYEDLAIPQTAKDTALDMIKKLDTSETVFRTYDYELYFFTGEYKNKYGSFYEEGKEKIKQIVSSSKNVEKDWNEWKASVQPKVDLVLKELNENLLKK